MINAAERELTLHLLMLGDHALVCVSHNCEECAMLRHLLASASSVLFSTRVYPPGDVMRGGAAVKPPQRDVIDVTAGGRHG